MSSCRYGNISGEFTLDVERSEGLDELLLEILYGDRIRKTIERLNYEWLKKMWKAPDIDYGGVTYSDAVRKSDRRRGVLCIVSVSEGYVNELLLP